MNVVLYEPEIPDNTGNIGRTCVAAGAALHLIEPLGFFLSEKRLKRAGMDYWEKLSLNRYADWNDFMEKHPEARLWYITTKGQQAYTEADFREDDYLVFGRESAGLPKELLESNKGRCLRIPMMKSARSLNLANSVAIVLYEALRQVGFPGLYIPK